MTERHSKVFVPVSVDLRLPDKSELYLVYCTHNENGNSMTMFPQMSHFLLAAKSWHVNSKTLTVTHWLEEKENVYVLSEQELKEEKKKEAIAVLEFARKSDYYGNYEKWIEGKITDEDFYELFNQQK